MQNTSAYQSEMDKYVSLATSALYGQESPTSAQTVVKWAQELYEEFETRSFPSNLNLNGLNQLERKLNLPLTGQE